MKIFNSYFGIFAGILILANQALGDFSGNHCYTNHSGSVTSLCKNREIPSNKARNFHRNSQQLECSSNVDHYIRRPQKFDFDAWATLVKSDQTQAAYELRRKQKPIEWKGTVPFVTVETWVWEDCEMVTSASKCGTTTRKRRWDCSYNTPRTCDSKGKNCRGGDRITKTCEESYEDPNSCYADIDHREYWDCSQESMTYTARYDRPSDWTPKSPGYKDPIPNKYDLLPGEVEDVQVLNNEGTSTSVKPFTKVGDAWNEYSITSKINGRDSVSCIQNGEYNADITIYTDKRLVNKKTPNAFRLPHDIDGHKIQALESDSVKVKDGSDFTIVQESGTSYIAGHPSSLKLDDTSTSMISLIAEQSRKNIGRETEKEKLGLGANDDKENDDKKDPAFFKNTKVKIELISDNKYWWNTSSTNRIIVDDIDAVQMDFRAFSSIPDIAFSDLWKIILNDNKNKNNNIYMVDDKSQRTLAPDRKYILKVSMYQKGAKGFYKQDCEEDSKAWDCQWYSNLIFWHRREKDYFSDSLDIYFRTPEKMVDERDFGRKVLDFIDIF